jgi:hypothetical protein
MGKPVKIPIRGDDAGLVQTHGAEHEQACDPPAAEPFAIRRRNRHARFRQADVVRVLKAITKAGFGSVGWRVKLTPDGAITIEAGAPLAQYQIEQEDGGAALDKWMTKHARATEGH